MPIEDDWTSGYKTGYAEGWYEALQAVKYNLSLRVLSSYHDGKLALEIINWSSVEDVLLTLQK